MSNEVDINVKLKAERLAEQIVGKPKLIPIIAAGIFAFVAMFLIGLYAQLASQRLDIFAAIVVSLLTGIVGYFDCRQQWHAYDNCVNWHIAKHKYYGKLD